MTVKITKTERHFIAIDYSFLEKLRNAEVTPSMYCTYTMLLKQSDWKTGVWWGSAREIVAGWGGQIEKRVAQMNLKALHGRGIAKSFHKPGSRRDYAMVIHGQLIRSGPLKGWQVDAWATTDPHNPVYIPPSGLMDGEIIEIQGFALDTKLLSESSAKSQRIVSETSANGGARNTLEVLDSLDFQEKSIHQSKNDGGKDFSKDKPSVIGKTPKPCPENGQIVANLSKQFTKTTGRPFKASAAHKKDIGAIVTQHGAPRVTACMDEFVQSGHNFDSENGGVICPASLFISQFEDLINVTNAAGGGTGLTYEQQINLARELSEAKHKEWTEQNERIMAEDLVKQAEEQPVYGDDGVLLL